LIRHVDEVLVLQVRPTGEADLLLTLLSKSQGRFDARVPGGRKSVKRFCGMLQPFTVFEAEMRRRNPSAQPVLETGHLMDPMLELRRSAASVCLASWFCEITTALVPPGTPEPRLAETLVFFLQRLKKAPAGVKHRHFYEARLLNELGFRPDLRLCSRTGAPLPPTAYLERARGTLICKPVVPVSGTVTASTRKALESAMDSPVESLGDVRLTRCEAEEARMLLTDLLLRHLPFRPRSLDLLERELRA